MQIEIIPFVSALLPQAGVLLAQRQQRTRATFPPLPTRFAEPAVAAQAISAALQRAHAQGFAAMRNGRLVAYLIGDLVIDSVWGRSGWVRAAGCAYDQAVDVEAVRDLYAALGAHWVSYGVFLHVALLPVSDAALLQAWFSLSFGIEQVHGIADLAAAELAQPAMPSGLTIRQAVPADRHHLRAMADVIWQTQVKAPVWGVMLPEQLATQADGWAELVDDPEATVWLALQDEEIVGLQGYWPAEESLNQLHIPARCTHLSVAGTRSIARGQGIGTRLTTYALAQARAAGYQFCEADWRSTNLLAARFWPRRGFQPVVYRLTRRIDQRIVWANGTPLG